MTTIILKVLVNKPKDEAVGFLGRYIASSDLQQEDFINKKANEIAGKEKYPIMVKFLDADIEV